jgi:peroxiredoxin
MMRTRWIVAAAAAIGVGVLAGPMIFGPEHVRMEEPELMASHAEGAAGCKADKKANLDFTLKDMNGAQVRLADFKGRPILLNYWATWCGPCKVEIPALNDLYAQYKDRGLAVIGISVDDDEPTLREFNKQIPMTYTVLTAREEEDALEVAGPVWGYPTTFFIGRDGSICGKHMGPATKEDFEREIRPLL